MGELCMFLLIFRLHFLSIKGNTLILSNILDRNCIEKYEVPIAKQNTLHKTGNRKTEYKMTIQEAQDDKYMLDASFENAYTSSTEYKKSLGSFINVKDNNGQTAFHIAASNNNLEGIKTLICYEVSLFIRDIDGKVFITLIE
jgi:ankyrin repeat protein